MIGRGLFVLSVLSSCVLSLPVTPSHLENEDVKVMKCIVEALADVLSRPHLMPVSQECLDTLKADDRLVTILRHHNFLKEMQDIAVQGGQERAQLQRGTIAPDPTTQAHETTGDAADRSMLEALGGPGERAILSQKRRAGNLDKEKENNERLRDEVSQDNDIAEEVQVKRENDESPGGHVSESVEEWSEGEPEKREEEEEEEEDYEEKRVNSEENSEENMIMDKKGAGSDGKKSKTKVKKFDEEDEEEKEKRSSVFSHKQDQKKKEEEDDEEEEREMKTGSRESPKQWARRGQSLQLQKKASGKEVQQLSIHQQVPHHSKEVTEEEEEEKKSTPEEKELQMIAQRAPEERRVSEEEGSASRKSEEPEIESLAAIESELENVAQKLHELRQG
ncbi:chromogranin-A [Mastacembelus armatus]|uniref:Chromogranin-A n=1 Tax=Mastacembelus armatus TaxID=205130 RepID=A0A3Q3M776_9TELE|nr:chromogranin-A [Mastacembelus armatus]